MSEKISYEELYKKYNNIKNELTDLKKNMVSMLDLTSDTGEMEIQHVINSSETSCASYTLYHVDKQLFLTNVCKYTGYNFSINDVAHGYLICASEDGWFVTDFINFKLPNVPFTYKACTYIKY